MYSKYIVTNFAYGTGPYLRTTDLAIAFNNELEKRGQKRLGIIVPLVYGEKQKRVMLEEFSAHEKEWPGEIMLDAALGAILKSIFYGDNSYEEALGKWVKNEERVSNQAHEHLSGTFSVETLSGERFDVDGNNIVVELARSPRIRYGVAPAYFTSFAYIAEILERLADVSGSAVSVDRALVREGVVVANRVEGNFRMHALAYPVTFSNTKGRGKRYPTEIEVPPIVAPPLPNSDNIEPGIFVTITGIPGLERLYADAARLGLKLCSNDSDAVPGSVHALPHIIPNENILFQFARSGWSSVWISMMSGTPLVVPDFDPTDDPEIYFNNHAVEDLGLGTVYRGQPLEEILVDRDRIKQAYEGIVAQVAKRWGTKNGTKYCARLFVEDFLKRTK